MTRIFFFLIGFALMVLGLSFIIQYFNLKTKGYNLSLKANYIIMLLYYHRLYYSIVNTNYKRR